MCETRCYTLYERVDEKEKNNTPTKLLKNVSGVEITVFIVFYYIRLYDKDRIT